MNYREPPKGADIGSNDCEMAKYKDHTHEDGGRCQLLDPWEHRWKCTRPKGHEGMHEAAGWNRLRPETFCITRWDDKRAAAFSL